MNNTNKIIKKITKTKCNTKKDLLAASGHSPQKRQQQQEDEEKVIKKKIKLKQKSKKFTNNVVKEITEPQQLQKGDESAIKQQEDEKKTKKKTKPKQNTKKITKNLTKDTEEPQQVQKPNENNVEVIGVTLQKPQQKLDITNIQIIKLDMDPKIKKSYSRKNNIKENFPNNTIVQKIETNKLSFLQEIEQQQQHDIQYYHKKAYMFMENLKRDYKRLALIYNACLKSEQEREKRNEEEIDKLKKKYQQLQVERTEIKRKRWCRYCESEANYLSSMGANCYCSPECEEKQNDLFNVMQEMFNS